VAVLERIGVETLRELASQAGIRSFTGRYGLALTLGGGDVRLLEMTAAYGIFDDGRSLPPQAILRVEESSAAVVEIPRRSTGDTATAQEYAPSVTRGVPVISPAAAYLITDILADDVARQGAFGRNSVLNLPFAAAVKTGTTTDWRDNWAVGYSTQRLVGVWVGNADNSPMVDVSGVDGAGPIWHDLMLLAHRTPPGAFARPPQIVDVEVCAPSGMLPARDCPRTRSERFLRGTEPTQADTQFQRIAVDLGTGQAATGATPANRRVERVYWLLPPEYHDWMVSRGIAIAPLGAPVAAHSGLTTPGTASSTGAQLAGAATGPRGAAPGPLQLAGPASYTAYQLHPGLPPESQQLEAVGYTTDGTAWHSLRLVVNGHVLAEAANRARLQAWWPMTLGAHAIWLEGEREAGGETQRSSAAQINVDPFTVEAVTLQTVD
jgi:membrane carboxypeptidase/penicillin-binding protein PbpC